MANRDSIAQIFKNKYGRTKCYKEIRSVSQKFYGVDVLKDALTYCPERKLKGISGSVKRIALIFTSRDVFHRYINKKHVNFLQTELLGVEVSYV